MDNIINHIIVEVRPMTPAELVAEGWDDGNFEVPPVLVLDNGVKLYPSRDTEGNGGGALFGVDGDNSFGVY